MEHKIREKRCYDSDGVEINIFTNIHYRAISGDGGWHEYKFFMDAVEHVIKEIRVFFKEDISDSQNLFKLFNNNIKVVRKTHIPNTDGKTSILIEYEELWPDHIEKGVENED